MATNAIQISPVHAIRQLLERQREQITVALPRQIGVDASKMIRVALSAISASPKLQKCDPVSILAAVIQAAQVGLVPDGFLGQAYLVPFWNAKNDRLEAKLMIGYRGFIQLAARGGKVSTIEADVIYAGDVFKFRKGTDAMLEHIPTLATKTRGAIIGAYAVARLVDGSAQFEVMPTDDIEVIKAGSKAADDGPWTTHWNEMARKTVVRKLAKYLPVNPEMVKAAVIDEYNEQGITLEGDADTGEVVIPQVPQAAVDNAVEQAKARVEEIRAKGPSASGRQSDFQSENAGSIPAGPTNPTVPEPALYTVEGKLVRFTKKVSSRGNPFMVINVAGHSKGIFVYKVDWHAHLQAAKNAHVKLVCKVDGSYVHLHDISKLGTTEFHEGVPVLQRGEPLPPTTPVPQEAFSDEDIPF